MSMFGKIGSWFKIPDEEDDALYEPEPPPAGKRNVVPIGEGVRRGNGGGAVAVFAPRSFADVTEVADALRSRQVCIVNLQGADRTLLQRVVDFTSGVAYTIDGRIQKLADAIYLIVPAGVNVSSDGLKEQVDADGLVDLSAKLHQHGSRFP
jgi:cell division inhibitor SepF